MKTNKSINVLWDDCLVGVLAMTPDRSVAFQYSDQWIERGISISPFSLPVSSKVYVPEKTYLTDCLVYLQTVFRMLGEDFC